MKTVLFYYSQSGQALSVAKNICEPMGDVVYKQIIPEQDYPFPWNKDEFFDTFPESRLGIPPSGIKPLDLSDVKDVNLVIIVGQSWFLSPSLPLQSFLADEHVREYLQGKNVVFVNVCRNMWLMTGRKIKSDINEIGAHLAGHIVLQDKHANLVSALSIVRWLMYGKKNASWLLPDAGVPDADIKGSSRFGEVILNACKKDDFESLQTNLIEAGAIDYKPSVLFLEKAGHRMFGHWARFIRKKGDFMDPHRRFRVNMFFYYLLIVLFLVSPFGQLFFYLTYPFQNKNEK
jgi:hypothetical protein